MSSAKVVVTGNRCGHISSSPHTIFFPFEFNRPQIIQKLMQSARAYYQAPRRYLTSLIKNRKTRSEGRESIMLIALTIIYNLELSTMTIVKNDYNFIPASLNEMSKQSGLTMSRGRRALAKLVNAGYLSVTKQFYKANDTYTGLASIREVTSKFWNELGFLADYSFQKHYKTKRLAKRDSKINARSILSKVGKAAGFIYHNFRKQKAAIKADTSNARADKAALISAYQKLCDAYSLKNPGSLASKHALEIAQKVSYEQLKNMIATLRHLLDTS
jgi:hypothetical protein